MPKRDREVAIVRGILAGNLFDVGATQTHGMHKDGRVDFHHTLGKLKPRPWLIDDLDPWLNRPRHRLAVVFVDNTGPDIVLGMIPFTRQLLLNGTRVILTANSTPSLNDVTIDELARLVGRVAGFDTVIAAARDDGSLRLVASGNGSPGIDLTRISPDLADAAVDADLVVLEGMGRAIETNLDATFTCDALKITMIKDLGVAEDLKAELFDLIFRYEIAHPPQ